MCDGRPHCQGVYDSITPTPSSDVHGLTIGGKNRGSNKKQKKTTNTLEHQLPPELPPPRPKSGLPSTREYFRAGRQEVGLSEAPAYRADGSSQTMLQEHPEKLECDLTPGMGSRLNSSSDIPEREQSPESTKENNPMGNDGSLMPVLIKLREAYAKSPEGEYVSTQSPEPGDYLAPTQQASDPVDYLLSANRLKSAVEVTIDGKYEKMELVPPKSKPAVQPRPSMPRKPSIFGQASACSVQPSRGNPSEAAGHETGICDKTILEGLYDTLRRYRNQYSDPVSDVSQTRDSPERIGDQTATGYKPFSSGIEDSGGYAQLPCDMNLVDLTVSDVSLCLERLNLGRLVDRFQQDQIDGALLESIDEQILLDDFGLSKFEARKLTKFVKGGWRPKYE